MNVTPVNNNQSFSANLKMDKELSQRLSATAIVKAYERFLKHEDLTDLEHNIRRIQQYGTDNDTFEIKRELVQSGSFTDANVSTYLNGKLFTRSTHQGRVNNEDVITYGLISALNNIGHKLKGDIQPLEIATPISSAIIDLLV